MDSVLRGAPMTVLMAGNGTLWIRQQAYDAMVLKASREFPKETGGVLLGYADAGDVDLVVEQMVGPGPRAVHRRHSFVPDHAYHEIEVARRYEESGRLWSYLGDWHSHPMGPCDLSDTDYRTLSRIARATEARAPRPVMLLLAGGRTERPERTSVNARGDAAETTAGDVKAEMLWSVCGWRMVVPPARRRLCGLRGDRGTIVRYECRRFQP